MKLIKSKLRESIQRKAVEYVRTYAKEITNSVIIGKWQYNTVCMLNVADYILTDEDRQPIKAVAKPTLYSSRPALCLLVDKVTNESFLHVIATEPYHGVGNHQYKEVTYGFFTGRYRYYFLCSLQGDLYNLDLIFDNARIDFLSDIGTPKWYRLFTSPVDLL